MCDMWSVVHFKLSQSTVLLFKMIASWIFVFIVSTLTAATFKNDKFVNSDRGTEPNLYCLLPPYPYHGRYTVSSYPSATPGESYPNVKLDVKCDIGYANGNATSSIFCVNGFWSSTMPSCVPDSGFCTLDDELRVEYRCVWVLGSLERSQECPPLVPSGTSVRPICRSPAYFSLKVLSEMHCRDGDWDYKPICKPACGLITQHRKLEGSSTNHAELPWHAVIYEKYRGLYLHSCGGSLISANKIISAAYCFSKNIGNLRPASDFLVSVNKMYHDYNDPRDLNSQESALVDIKILSSYRGHSTNYMDNIAIVEVEKPFFFHLSVRPVCLDFDNNLDRTQLTEGNYGKVASWSYYHTQISLLLDVNDLYYKKNEYCYDMLPTDTRHLLSNDKFCAVPSYDTLYPYGSSSSIGGGVAFLESTTQRYYLRGVLSLSLLPKELKNNTVLHLFTSILKHEHFIKQLCNNC